MTIKKYPNRTYKLMTNSIQGFTEDISQAVRKIVLTDRYAYPIYSRSYGVNLKELLGKNEGYVKSEAKRRITEALKYDDRIRSVEYFKFEFIKPDILKINFFVNSEYFEVSI